MLTSKETYNVIASGSKGNCEIAMKGVVIDVGVPFSRIKPYIKDIKIILLSHSHSDHFNKSTILRIQNERPSVRVACGEWMKDLLEGVSNVDVLDLNKWYDYDLFKISIGKLYHDVPNCFFRLDFSGYKIFRATDTGTLDGVSARSYDLYAVEHNYDEDKANKAIELSDKTGVFCHARGSIKTHLSHRQAWEFITSNSKETSEVIKLHKSSSFY